MRLLIRLAMLGVICLIVIGFIRGWFTFTGPNRDADRQSGGRGDGRPKQDEKQRRAKAEEKITEKVEHYHDRHDKDQRRRPVLDGSYGVSDAYGIISPRMRSSKV